MRLLDLLSRHSGAIVEDDHSKTAAQLAVFFFIVYEYLYLAVFRVAKLDGVGNDMVHSLLKSVAIDDHKLRGVAQRHCHRMLVQLQVDSLRLDLDAQVVENLVDESLRRHLFRVQTQSVSVDGLQIKDALIHQLHQLR